MWLGGGFTISQLQNENIAQRDCILLHKLPLLVAGGRTTTGKNVSDTLHGNVVSLWVDVPINDFKVVSLPTHHLLPHTGAEQEEEHQPNNCGGHNTRDECLLFGDDHESLVTV